MPRVLVLIDGQNLYHGAKDAWNDGSDSSPYCWPSYDVVKLARMLSSEGSLEQVRFYTGVPRREDSLLWHSFWTNKLRALRSQGVHVYRGRINRGGEKGVDVSLAVDLICLTYQAAYDIAVIVSQDADFGPAVRASKEIAKGRGDQLIFKSAFPANPEFPRGVPGTKWIQIPKAVYDSCFDPTDYRPRA